MVKKYLYVLFFFFPMGLFAQEHLNILSFNIRFDNPKDSVNAWPHRKDFAASQILFHEAHIVGIQEGLHHQLGDLQERLQNYKWVGVARGDGKTKGEYSAIFYDATRLSVIDNSTFWLSENPSLIGKAGWDAALPRIVTWAYFRDKKTKKKFYVFNTHFDHVGKIARKESAKLILQKIKEIARTNSVIVTGDFNTPPADEPYQTMIDKSSLMSVTDAREKSVTGHYGPTGTFNGFTSKETSNHPIDYIFIKGKVDVLQHATLSQTWQGRFSSDHFPVFGRIKIN